MNGVKIGYEVWGMGYEEESLYFVVYSFWWRLREL